MKALANLSGQRRSNTEPYVRVRIRLLTSVLPIDKDQTSVTVYDPSVSLAPSQQ